MNKIIIILASLVILPNIVLAANLDSTTKCEMNDEEKNSDHCADKINPLLLNDTDDKSYKNKTKPIVNNDNGTVTVTNGKTTRTITPPKDKQK